MNNKQATDILRAYNDWRRLDHDPSDAPYTPHQIGEAIDTAIAALEHKIPLTLDGITDAVCAATGLTIDEVRMKGRFREYAEARWMIWWIARKYFNTSVTSLARYSNRDHALVIYGIKKAGEYMANPLLNPEWVKKVNAITDKLIKDR